MKRFYSLLIAFIVAISASMAANTQLFLVGGFSGWGFSPENELSTTDGDYYVATYPTGSEIELSGDFKLADPTWNILNYGGNLQVEAGKSYTLVKVGGNLSAVGKIKISKIEFTVSTATLKITGATSANPFDLSKDQGVSLVENSTNGEKFVSKLTFKGNGVYTGTYTVPSGDFGLKVGGDGNFNTIDYGWNGNYIVLGESYILKKGEMLFAAVYPEEGDWKAGDVFDVQVTFTADWTATLLLTKSTVTPTPDPEPDPDPEPTPVPEITDIKVSSFPYTEVGQSSTATATYTLVNATSATATLTGTHAKYFKILSQSVTNGKGTVEIQFTPDSESKYDAVLNIASGSVTVTKSIRAFGVEPAPVPDPVISNIQIASFGEVLIGETKTLVATYTIENATSATASISGAYASYFKILSQSVTSTSGSVVIEFAPESEGYFKPTLTITSGKVSENVTLSGLGIEPEIIISNIKKPSFTGAEEDKVSTAKVTFSLEGAKTATATISGADASYFKILSVSVNDGVGTVEMEFAPNISRKYDATLTITAGKKSESISFNALADEAPVTPAIKYLKVEEFAKVNPKNSASANITFTLVGASSPTVSISGIDMEEGFFTLGTTSREYNTQDYTTPITFTPKVAGAYEATITVRTAEGLTATIDFVAVCETATYIPVVDKKVKISNLKVPAFEDTQVGKTSFVTATFKVQGTTCATAALSGTNATSFKIMSQSVTDGNGEAKIKFVPSKEGEYNATLTVYAGNETVTANLKGKTTAAPEPGPGDDPSDDPTDDPDPEPGPGDDPTPDPDPEPEPDPYPEYPILGYLYIVDCENDRYDEIAKYEPITNSDVEYFLVPEKLEQKIYGCDIYKFEVRNPEGIRVWNKDDVYNSSFSGWYTFDEYEGVDISKTPCYAKEVWYESIEDMATWRVVYEFHKYDEPVIEKMQADSNGVFVATFEAIEESHAWDGFYFCLGDKDDPIMELGLTKYGNFLDENQLQIPQGFKVNIYLDDTNWETEFKYYYELLPLGDPWDKGYIDLGLTSGLCWATTNLGATEPEGEGLHFAWGEIEPKDNYSYNTYKWANLLEDNEYIKYVTKDRYGFVDFRNTLDPSDDAANEALTSKWHIPTLQDAEELLRECTLEKLEYKGVEGYYIKGPNGNVIFLPAVGKMVKENYEECTNGGKYWTSTLHEDYQDQANVLFFSGTWSLEVNKNPRVEGLPIRPVIHRDYVAIDEVPAIDVYAKEGTIYSELDFEIYNLTGINVTHLNGSLEGIYIVKTNEGNRLISVW